MYQHGIASKAVYGITCTFIRKVHGRIVNKHGRETILASLTGVVSDAEKDTMRQLREEIGLAETHKRECLDKMLQTCRTYYPNELRRLMTIPGINSRLRRTLHHGAG